MTYADHFTLAWVVFCVLVYGVICVVGLIEGSFEAVGIGAIFAVLAGVAASPFFVVAYFAARAWLGMPA